MARSTMLFVWKYVGALVAVFTIATSAGVRAQTPQTGSGQTAQILLDKSQYAPGETSTLRLTIPASLRPSLDYVFIYLRPAGSRERGNWMRKCGWPVAEGLEKPCPWQVPMTGGEYELYMTGAITENVGTVFATVRFRVGNPPAQPVPTPVPTEGTFRSAQGYMTLATPATQIVLGQELKVRVTVPAPKEYQPTSGRMSWSASAPTWEEKQKAPEVGKSPDADSVYGLFAKGGTQVVTVKAPWIDVGRFDLRLFNAGKLVDVLTIPVGKGWKENAVAPNKTHYVVGETIGFTATLPNDGRHYYGHWSGPTVVLFPLKIDGKDVSKEQAIEMLGHCLVICPGILGDAAFGTDANPWDGGHAVRPGTYTATDDLSKPRAFRAATPGVYELRLYDRGPDYKLRDYVDLFFAKSERITIEAPGATPDSLIFGRLKVAPLQSTGRGAPAGGMAQIQASGGAAHTPAPATPATHGSKVADYEELKELTLDELFYVIAVFQMAPSLKEPDERTVTLEWVANDAKQSRTLTLKRKNPGVYVSAPILPTRTGGGS